MIQVGDDARRTSSAGGTAPPPGMSAAARVLGTARTADPLAVRTWPVPRDSSKCKEGLSLPTVEVAVS